VHEVDEQACPHDPHVLDRVEQRLLGRPVDEGVAERRGRVGVDAAQVANAAPIESGSS
jgi:hypothetical protein